MDVYGRFAGKMTLVKEQEARFEALAARALPAPVPVEPETNADMTAGTEADPESGKTSDGNSTAW